MALGLGANLGDAEAQLRFAASSLRSLLTSFGVADLYRTRPHGRLDQPDFLNTAVVGATELSPGALLATLKRLELLAGRTAAPRSAPRRLDLDLLLFGDQSLALPGLIVPHPRLLERRFALAPLAELAPEWPIPGTALTVSEALRRVGQEGDVVRLGWGAARDETPDQS